MRSIILAILAVLVASCSDLPAGDGGAPTSGPGGTSTSVSTTTTAAPETTGTTAAATTTTTTATTTTTTLPPVPGSPVDALDSFEWEFTTGISAADSNVVTIRNTGVYVDGEFSCEVATGFPGAELTTLRFLATDEGLHLDAGEGFFAVDEAGPERANALGICPGSNVFWEELTGGGPLRSDGEPETVNGQEATRVDLTGLVSDEPGLGLFPSPSPGVEFDQLVFWITEDDWITALEISGDLAPEELTALTGSTADLEGRLELRVDVTNPNDPDLAVPSP